MKVVSSIQSTAALHVNGDEAVPERGINNADLIAFIADFYKFAVKPQIPPNMPPAFFQNLVFQSGILIKENERYPILQLALIPNGDLATATTTDIADMILDDFVEKLDGELGFRYAGATMRRTYQSNLIVKFERGLEEMLEGLHKMETILAREIERSSSLPFKIKRLAFGGGDPIAPNTLTLQTIENGDFTLERRHGAPYSENRYFCSAPLRTKEHIRVLETLEREFG